MSTTAQILCSNAVTRISYPIRAVRVERIPGVSVVHNMTVEGLHNYFVGRAGFLVHNVKTQ